MRTDAQLQQDALAEREPGPAAHAAQIGTGVNTMLSTCGVRSDANSVRNVVGRMNHVY